MDDELEEAEAKLAAAQSMLDDVEEGHGTSSRRDRKKKEKKNNLP